MALLNRRQHFPDVCWLRTATVILLLCWLQSSFAYGDVYMVNTSIQFETLVIQTFNNGLTGPVIDEFFVNLWSLHAILWNITGNSLRDNIFKLFLPFESCKQVNQILIGDCQRGCRLFDSLFIQDSIFLQFDDTIALPNCQHCKFERISISLNVKFHFLFIILRSMFGSIR